MSQDKCRARWPNMAGGGTSENSGASKKKIKAVPKGLLS